MMNKHQKQAPWSNLLRIAVVLPFLGLTIFIQSCQPNDKTPKQNVITLTQDGVSQVIAGDSIKVVEEDNGIAIYSYNEGIPSKTSIDVVKSPDSYYHSASDEAHSSTTDEVFSTVDVMPEFPGGTGEMFNYISKNIKYPLKAREDNIQGKVYLSLIVEADGSISNVSVLRGIGGGCDEEAVRVFESMPKWKPGTKDGNAVRVSYTVPMVFLLQ